MSNSNLQTGPNQNAANVIQNQTGGQTSPASNVNVGQTVGNLQNVNQTQTNPIVSQNKQDNNNNQVVNNQNNTLNNSTNSASTANSELSQADIEKQGAINILNEQLKVIEDQAKQIKTTYDSIKDPVQKQQNLALYNQAIYNNQLQQVELKKKLCALKQNDALSSEFYQDMKKNLGDAPDDVLLKQVLGVMSNIIGQLDYDEQKKITKELKKAEGLSAQDKLDYIKLYLKQHPNFLKSDRDVMRDQNELVYENFSNILSKDKQINEAISEKKDQIYQDINRSEKLNEQIRKLSKEIAEIDEQIGLWEKFKDLFGLSQLCKQKRECEADQQELKDKKQAAKIRESQMNEPIRGSERTLRDAISIINQKNQELTNHFAKNTVSKERTMQIIPQGNVKGEISNNNAKIVNALTLKNNSQTLWEVE